MVKSGGRSPAGIFVQHLDRALSRAHASVTLQPVWNSGITREKQGKGKNAAPQRQPSKGNTRNYAEQPKFAFSS